jgi:hypothetical protein
MITCISLQVNSIYFSPDTGKYTSVIDYMNMEIKDLFCPRIGGTHNTANVVTTNPNYENTSTCFAAFQCF